MQSPNRKYVPELDQLRGFAALLVFFYHSVNTGMATFGRTAWPHANPFDALLIEGHTGVALFMVLSGFILARGALGSSIKYGQFLTNRALRILPLMTLVVVFAIYANKVDLQGILAPFLLLDNVQPRLFNDVTGLSGTVWTISVEFQFYLIAPFLFAFVYKGGLRYVGLLLLLLFIFKCLVLFPHFGDGYQLYEITYYTIIGRLSQFVIGIALALMWPDIEFYFERRSRSALSLTAGAVFAATCLSLIINYGGGGSKWHPWMFAYREIEALIWAALICGYTLSKPLSKMHVVEKAITRVGVISFSLYILHWPLENDFWSLVTHLKLFPFAPTVPVTILYTAALLPFVVAISYLSYTVVEKPFLALRRRYIEGKSELADSATLKDAA